MIRVVVADDHPIVRSGIVALLQTADDIEVVGEASTGEEAVELAAALEPDIVLMDLRMPGIDGDEATARILAARPETRVLILTTYESDDSILSAIESGASGYLLKAAPQEEILAGLRAVARGDVALAPRIAALLVQRVKTPVPSLSPRETEVLALVAGGSTNRDAAARLFISEATVKTHLLHIYAKLGVTDRAAAVAEAFNRGLLTPGQPERRLS